MPIIDPWTNLHAAPWFHTLAPYLPWLVLWEGFWKGLALWHSGRRGQPWWFVILLVVNSVGILSIVYLFAIAKLKPAELFTKKT